MQTTPQKRAAVVGKSSLSLIHTNIKTLMPLRSFLLYYRKYRSVRLLKLKRGGARYFKSSEPGFGADPVFAAPDLFGVYEAAQPGFKGRCKLKKKGIELDSGVSWWKFHLLLLLSCAVSPCSFFRCRRVDLRFVLRVKVHGAIAGGYVDGHHRFERVWRHCPHARQL